MRSMATRRESFVDLQALYAEYSATLGDGRLEDWPRYFSDSALYRITSRDNAKHAQPLCFVYCEGNAMLRDRVAALDRTVFFRERTQRCFIGPPSILDLGERNKDIIEASVPFVVYESRPDHGTRLLSCGVARDRILKCDGTLLFQERLCILDASLLEDSLVFPI